MGDKNQGEGNKEADRRYREGVRKTIEETTPEDRADAARTMTREELDAAERAAERARKKAKS